MKDPFKWRGSFGGMAAVAVGSALAEERVIERAAQQGAAKYEDVPATVGKQKIFVG